MFGGYAHDLRSRLSAITSGLPTNRELVLLWFALQRLANREQEDGTFVFRMRRKEVNYIIVEEGQPGRTQVLGIRSQVDPAADDACLQLDGSIAAVPDKSAIFLLAIGKPLKRANHSSTNSRFVGNPEVITTRRLNP